MAQILPNEIITQILLKSQYPKISEINRSFRCISMYPSLRARFLILKHGLRWSLFRGYKLKYFNDRVGVSLIKFGALDIAIHQDIDDIKILLIQLCSRGFINTVQEICMRYQISKHDILTANNTALKAASRNGHSDIVEFLLDNGCDPSSENFQAFRYAASAGHLEVVKIFLRYNCNVNADNDYSVRYAAANGHFQVVKLLVDHGANASALDDFALVAASSNGHLELVSYLLNECGARIQSRGFRCLMQNLEPGRDAMFRLLVQHLAKADLDDELKELIHRNILEQTKNLNEENNLSILVTKLCNVLKV